MDKKINNLLSYGDFSKRMFEKPKVTKRTEVAKDIIKESHLSNEEDQLNYVCRVAKEAPKEILTDIICELIDLEVIEPALIYNLVEDVLNRHGLDETQF